MQRGLLFALILAACGPRANGGPPVTAFTGVSVIPMDRDAVLADQTVLVRDGKITAIGPPATVDVPSDATKIDGTGKFLIPGLGDMHTHLGSRQELAMLVANGVTFVRNMWGGPLHLIWKKRIDRGALLGPKIWTAGPLMDGKDPIWSGSTVVENAADAERAVIAQKTAGYDFLKVYNKLTPEAYDAIAAAAKKHQMKVIGHIPTLVGLERALDQGQASIEHLTGYMQAIQRDDSPVKNSQERADRVRLPELADEAKIPAIAERTRAAGAWNCPTLVVMERFNAMTRGDDLKGVTGLDVMSPMTLASWDPEKDFRFKDPVIRAKSKEMQPRAIAVNAAILGALHKTGARFLIGTDFPNPFVVPGYSEHDELALFVAAGFTPYEALRAATHDAAEFLGALAELGTIEVGKRADLLLLDANPLGDINATKSRAGVMIGGRWLPKEELAKMIAGVKDAYRPHDRFAGLPEMPPNSVEFTIIYNGVNAGAERVSMSAGPKTVAQAIFDEPYMSKDLVTQDAGTFEMEAERIEGPVRTRVTLQAGKARVSTTFEDGPKVDVEKPAGVILGPWIAAWYHVAHRAKDLAEGASMKLDTLVLDAVEDPLNGTLEITRKPDQNGLKVYEADDQRPNAKIKVVMTVDAGGAPKRVELAHQYGSVVAERP